MNNKNQKKSKSGKASSASLRKNKSDRTGEEPDISLDKLYAAADFVASHESVQLRGYLYGLAKSGAAGNIIEQDLDKNKPLKKYLKDENFKDLNKDEIAYCRDWGEKLAIDIQNKPNQDAYVVHALVDRWDPSSGPAGG